MSDKKIRLSKVIRELNISLPRAKAFLEESSLEESVTPNTKISQEVFDKLTKEFASDLSQKKASEEVSKEQKAEKEAILAEKRKEQEAKEEALKARQEVIRAKAEELSGLKKVGHIDLDTSKSDEAEATKKEDTPKEVEAPKVEAVKAEAAKEEPKADKAPSEDKKPAKQQPKADKKSEKKEAEPVKETKTVKEDKSPALKVEAKKENILTKDGVVSSERVTTQYKKLDGPRIAAKKVDLTAFEEDKKRKENEKKKQAEVKKKREEEKKKRKRKRITADKNPNLKTNTGGQNRPGGPNRGGPNRGGGQNRNRRGPGQRGGFAPKVELTDEQIQKQIKETLDKLTSGKSKASKFRRGKRDKVRRQAESDMEKQEIESKILKVAEFVTVNEVANMMDVSVAEVIGSCMGLGLMVTMNQRLDMETLELVASEFGFEVEKGSDEIEEAISLEEDKEEDLQERAPIVTIMGHVDHGKTSLLDYIREANVIAGEAGGITQHIGAYNVELANGKKVTFLDTPGHEAFTAMRARGTQLTDIVIIVISADDSIMPQTKEAISHAQAAGVPMIFAINKIDKPDANPDKVKEALSSMNLLVEEWGGKIQSQDLSAKTGQGVDDLLEKVMLEAELLELKANPDREANGSVVEAELDKGRGYVSTVLVQNGTLKVGDYILAGKYHGKVRAMFDERGKKVKSALPSQPVAILGLDGAPQAGDKFHVFKDEKEAKDIASRRDVLMREQSVRSQKQMTLDEIGRRIAVGDFQELNIIIKGDVDGSVEALTDSLQKLTTEEIQIKIIHRAVGQITESDILLASASSAIIIGFNVRPSSTAKALADKEQIDIRTYSIIYDAINDLKDAMEGMLSPDIKEEVIGNVEIRETFKISKVGTIAGCMVLDGKITRKSKVRIIREGVVVYTGNLASLKRFQDDAKEVTKGYECGLSIEKYNDIRAEDILEAFEEVEVRKKL